MNTESELNEMKALFSDGSGFGDPDARRNAELRLQVLLAEQQNKTGRRLNMLTLMLVIVGVLNVVVLVVQLLDK